MNDLTDTLIRPFAVAASADHDLRQMLAELLHLTGYTVMPTPVTDLASLYAEFTHLTVGDIVLLALHTTVTGRQLSEQLGQWRTALPPDRVLLLLLTENEIPDDETFALVDDYIVLPATRSTILMRIRAITRLYNRVRAMPAVSYSAGGAAGMDAPEAEDRYRVVTTLGRNYAYAYLRDATTGQFVREWGDETGMYRITGYSYRELQARGGWLSIVHPDDREIAQRHLASLIAGQSAEDEYRLITADQRTIWVRLTSEPFLDPQTGEVRRMHGIVQDVTDQHRVLESQREQRQIIDMLEQTLLTLSSTLDREEVLDRILVNIAQVIPYDMADMMLIEHNRAYIARHHGYDTLGITWAVPQTALDINQIEGLRTMCHTGAPLLIPDVREYPGWSLDPIGTLVILSYLGAPVHAHGRVVGFLNLYSRRAFGFNQEQADQMRLLASQVSVAISNAQLYDIVARHSDELERRIRDLVTIYESGQALNATLEVEEICNVLYHEVAQRMFNCQQMRVLLYNAATATLETVYAMQDGAPLAEMPAAYPLDDGPASVAIRTHVTQFRDGCIYEPLISRDQVLGVLTIARTKPVPDSANALPDEVNLTLLSTIAGQAAIALDNARLYKALGTYAADLELRVQARTAELEKALIQEQALNAMRARFLVNVRHEFYTPLTLILSASELLERYNERMTPDQRQDRYNMIRNSVNEMTDLLDSVLMMSHLETGEVGSYLQPIDLDALTQTVLHNATRHNHLHRVIYEATGDCTEAMIDTHLWERILKELLDNAIRYSSPGDAVHCRLRCDQDALVFTMADRGMGIPADDLPHVFEMFYRGINAQNIPGGGLGLAIVKRLVTLHNGTISIQSEVAQGTLITITLPRAAVRRLEP